MEGMEAQLNWLIKEVADAIDVARKEMLKYIQHGFVEVRTKQDYFYV